MEPGSVGTATCAAAGGSRGVRAFSRCLHRRDHSGPADHQAVVGEGGRKEGRDGARIGWHSDQQFRPAGAAE